MLFYLICGSPFPHYIILGYENNIIFHKYLGVNVQHI